MNHLEAQSYIMPFIEGKIPEAKQEDFVLHMNSCPKCREELEIYYTLMVGMKQIDSKQEITTDFSADLSANLKKLEHRFKGRRRRKFSAFSILITAIIVAIFVFYGRALSKVYLFEQDKKVRSQGNNYFFRELNNTLLISDRDRVLDSEKLSYVPEVSIFKRLDIYTEIKENMSHIMNIGDLIFDNREEEIKDDTDEETAPD